jgi:hypothetical protein
MRQHGCPWRLGSIVLLMGLLLSLALGSAQEPPENQPPAEIREKQAILLGVQRSIAQLEDELKAKQEELRSPSAEGRQQELLQQIKTISDKLDKLRETLNAVASGVDLQVFSGKPEDLQFDWQRRVLDLLRPLLNEFTRLTARPRELERLRSEIAGYLEQGQVAERAIANIDLFAAHSPDPALSAQLRQIQREWEARRQDLSTRLSIAHQQLEQKLSEQQSFSDSVKHLFQIFFRSRGRNLLLASLAFAGTWLLFHQLHGWVQRVSLLRRKRRTFSARLFHVIYTVLTVLGATLSFLLVLYLFEDWVLLTLTLLILLGIVWTSKHTLPGYVKEALLLLNLGAVREGERVIYDGVPWFVRSLGFDTHLVNPELMGGNLHLPLRDFLALRSRPFEPDEPWFPTRIGDWVLLEHETLGKVILQTPEMVRVVLLGGSRQTFSVQDFLAQSPTVLSTGFRLAVPFGLDYQHQALMTREIPATLASRLREALVREGAEKDLVNLTVEFEEAGVSSLNLRVLADFSGAAAPHYHVLRSAIQRICVEACTDYGWIMPFTQLTLHMASPTNTGSPPEVDGSPHDGGHDTDASH